eukprot:scaffold2857_cov344-Pavlova_lutheri.AAC.2
MQGNSATSCARNCLQFALRADPNRMQKKRNQEARVATGRGGTTSHTDEINWPNNCSSNTRRWRASATHSRKAEQRGAQSWMSRGRFTSRVKWRRVGGSGVRRSWLQIALEEHVNRDGRDGLVRIPRTSRSFNRLRRKESDCVLLRNGCGHAACT